jgi:tetratricopeptide (TPR) repeat protein
MNRIKNIIKIDGNDNIVFQDIEGNVVTLAINELLDKVEAPYKETIKANKLTISTLLKLQEKDEVEISRLNREIADSAEKISILSEKLTAIIGSLAGRDLEKEGVLLRKALDLLLDGKLDDALEVLNDSLLDEEYLRLEGKQRELDNEKKNLASTHVFKAQLLELKFDSNNAAKHYNRAFKIYPSWENAIQAGNFYYQQEEYVTAEEYYHNSVNNANNDLEKAKSFHDLGNLYKQGNRLDLAEEQYKKALVLIDTYPLLESEYWFKASLLNSYANYFYKIHAFDKALDFYQKATDLFRTLADKNPAQYLYQYSNFLANLASAQKDMRLFKEAYSSYEAYVTIIPNLIAQNINEAIYAKPYMQALNGIIEFQLKQLQFKEALTNSKQALDLARRMAEKDPNRFLHELVATLQRYGDVLMQTNNLSEAEALFEESLFLQQRLANVNPEKYTPLIAGTFHGIAVLNVKNKEYEKAIIYYKKALEIRKNLVSKHPPHHLPELSHTLTELGLLETSIGNLLDAQEYLMEALSIRRQLHADSAIYQFELAHTLKHTAALFTSKRDFKTAEELLMEAIRLFKSLVQDDLDVYIPELANAFFQLYFLKYDMHEYSAAEKSILECLALYDKLSNKHPEVFLPCTIEAAKSVSHIYYKMGKIDKASFYAQKLDRYKLQLKNINHNN